MSQLYPDSKTFVDKKLKHPPGKIIKKFEELIKGGEKLTVEQIREVSVSEKEPASLRLFGFVNNLLLHFVLQVCSHQNQCNYVHTYYTRIFQISMLEYI